jgi:hypothetical protein
MKARTRQLLLGALAASVLFLVMLLLIQDTAPWQAKNATNATTDANDLTAVTDSLFGPNVIAFEVLGILLTAAMIGALVIARPLDAPTDESRYSHPTAEQKAQADQVSDVGHADMDTGVQK